VEIVLFGDKALSFHELSRMLFMNVDVEIMVLCSIGRNNSYMQCEEV
jgi:hypothetical protein